MHSIYLVVFVFNSPVPQHVSRAEEWVEEDSDTEEDSGEKHTNDNNENNIGSSQLAEPYTTVLGVRIGYSDAKAIASMDVVEVFSSYMPENVLGMTDCTSKIWILYGLGYLKKHVLIHEIEHVKDPAASEYIIRLRAKQKVPVNYLI